mgnify:CR=1 FL=1
MRRTLEQNPDITIIMEVNSLKYRDPRAFIRSILDDGFTLRYIDYDSNIKDVTEEQLVSKRNIEGLLLPQNPPALVYK